MRKFVALMAAAVMLFALCASASAATQVTIWHTYTNDQQAALEKFAADFNASQSDYEVVVESQAYSGFLDSVYNAVANGVGPNIIINYASTAADYVKDGLVVDLSKYVFDDEIGMADIYNSLPDSIKNLITVTDDAREASERGIATASQESVDENNGRLTVIQGHTYTMNENVKLIVLLGDKILEAINIIRANTEYCKQISSMRNKLDEIGDDGLRVK